MKTNLIMPEEISVGYQYRNDTYSKKLAYVTYYENKVLKKEKSWKSWIDSTIPIDEFKNEPLEGFIFNKHVGGEYWSNRQSYIRVYDPRGFEIEITIDNLLYLLEYCNFYKGKGIEGKLIYVWNKTRLILLPINSPDYKEIVSYNKNLKSSEKITKEDLIPGYTYLNNKNEKLIYLGRFDYYANESKTTHSKQYFFGNLEQPASNYVDIKYDEDFKLFIQKYNLIKNQLIKVVSEEIPSNFTKMLEMLEYSTCISPMDLERTEYCKLTNLNQFLDAVRKGSSSFYISLDQIYMIYINGHTKEGDYISDKDLQLKDLIEVEIRELYGFKIKILCDNLTLEEFFNSYQIFYRKEYLENGNLYSSTLNNYHKY